jgi:invasion protein IalB
MVRGRGVVSRAAAMRQYVERTHGDSDGGRMASMTRGRGGPYPEDREKRSLVPILAVIAGGLALAVVGVVVLFALGVFNRGAGGTSSVATLPATARTAQPLTPTQAFPAATTTDVARTVAARPANDEPPVRSTHGDWQIRCDTPVGAIGEQCVLMQFVTAEDRDNVGLTVIVLKTADRQSRIMRVLAPLGVLLPSGLGLRIDQADMGRAGFVRCLPNGCIAEVILDDALLDMLGRGSTATFVIFQTPEEGIGIPISLNGFQAGFAALP